jgi:hypothetical protein
MRVAITVLSNRGHNPAFSRSLTGLISHMNSRSYGLEGYTVNIAPNVSLLPKGRQDAIKEALKQNCTHVLFIDDDMEFTPDILQILASRKVHAIGVNAVRKMSSLNHVAIGFDGQQITSKGKSGLEEVAHVGMGIFLLDLSALPPAPHFEILWNPKTNDYDSEDTYFCEKLRKHGVKIYTDHDASQKTGHVGDFTYTLNSYG